MFTVLPEAKRLAYLEAMGIDSYFPRINLPGAKQSVLCQTLPVREEAATEGPVDIAAPMGAAPDAAPQLATGHDTLLALMPQIGGRESPATKKVEAAPAQTAVAKSAALRFNLRFFQLPGLAMIVDSSPDSAPEPPMQRFVANLLLALSALDENWEGAIKPNLQQHVFRWPLVGNAQIDQGEQAAREAVNASVFANRERHAIPLILLLGEQAAQFGAGDYPDARVICLESISHYLVNPAAKRELWQALLAAR